MFLGGKVWHPVGAGWGLLENNPHKPSLIPMTLTGVIWGVIIYAIININGVFIMHINNYLSSTHLAQKTAATLNSFDSGEVDKIIILKNNAPKAILMSIDSYEAMEEEIEDLRLTTLALSRIQSFDPGEAISHEEMMKKYVK